MKNFVEGGGKSSALKTECRKAFGIFLRKVLAQRPGCKLQLEIVVAGSRGEAYNKFCTELRTGEQDALLLIDSEEVLTNLHPQTSQTLNPWQHLEENSKWAKPQRATSDQLHFMGVTMETWLVADADTLATYYGPRFAAAQLPKRTQLEQEPKEQLNDSSKAATRSSTKGSYAKGGQHDHSFALLQQLNPAVVEAKLPHAKRLFDYLRLHC